MKEENIDDQCDLSFKQIDERAFKVFNKRTGRFHDVELGIDVVY